MCIRDRLDAAVVLVVERLPLLARATAEDLGDLRPGIGARRLELHLDQLGPAGPVAEGGPELRLQGAAGDPAAVGGFVGVVAEQPAGELLLAAPRLLAVAEVAPGDQREPG